jgi:uncharacterized protein YegL
MIDDLLLRKEELTENPTPRVPVCLALDVSGSMAAGRKMDELNIGIREFFNAVRSDEMARFAAEIAIVTFESNAKKIMDFSSIDRQSVPILSPGGYTAMGEGVNMALDLLEQAKRIYSQMGVDYYQPWLVLMTDGEPAGESGDVTSSAMNRCQELVRKRKLTVFPIAIGDDANIRTLSMFSPNLEPLRVEATDFRKFFSWLAKSINTVSLSNPGDAEATSFGESAYKKMSADFHTQMMKRGR